MNDGFDFEAASSQLRALLSPGMKVTEVKRGQLDEATARARLRAALERGQQVINYIGHGSLNTWRGNLLTAGEAQALSHPQLPMFFMMSCLNGYFQDPAESLGEALLKAEHGGAIAVWASSGISLPQMQSPMNRELYGALFDTSSGGLTIGEAIQRAKRAASDTDIRRTWILLGDPSLRLRLTEIKR
jgi:hypothetical protein